MSYYGSMDPNPIRIDNENIINIEESPSSPVSPIDLLKSKETRPKKKHVTYA